LHFIVHIRRYGMVAPKPAHHVRKNRPALLLPVQADSPRVIDVIALLSHRVDEADVLEKPVSLLVIFAVSADTAMVVSAVLEEDANWFLFGRQYFFGVDVSAAQVGEA